MDLLNSQKQFWDAESADDVGYPARFLGTASREHWIDQLKQVQSLGGNFKGEILELGGGSQLLSRWLANLPGTNVTCTDISDQRMDDFNRHYGNLPNNLKLQGNVNAERLPYSDKSFDWIVGDAMLHHIENLRTALYEMRRCLKPGGQAIFIREPVIGHLDFLKRRLKPWLQRDWHVKYRSALKVNRYEYAKTYYQWKEEFYQAGWDATQLPGWYYLNATERLRSRWAPIFTCSVTWKLRPVSDVD